MVKSALSASAMEKLLKRAGASRVSEDAKESLRDYLEDLAVNVGQKAIRFAQHSGRKTVKSSDIKLATK